MATFRQCVRRPSCTGVRFEARSCRGLRDRLVDCPAVSGLALWRAAARLYGMFLNGLGVVLVALLAAFVESVLREQLLLDYEWSAVFLVVCLGLVQSSSRRRCLLTRMVRPQITKQSCNAVLERLRLPPVAEVRDEIRSNLRGQVHPRVCID